MKAWLIELIEKHKCVRFSKNFILTVNIHPSSFKPERAHQRMCTETQHKLLDERYRQTDRQHTASTHCMQHMVTQHRATQREALRRQRIHCNCVQSLANWWRSQPVRTLAAQNTQWVRPRPAASPPVSHRALHRAPERRQPRSERRQKRRLTGWTIQKYYQLWIWLI